MSNFNVSSPSQPAATQAPETRREGHPLVQRFAVNDQGRDLIVGDIHGHFSKLAEALGAICFDPTAGDRLFSVGDLVDRGPQSEQALDWICEPWFHAVQGNHEDMAIRWPEGRIEKGAWVRNMPAGHYAANGGAWNIAQMPDQQREVSLAFAALPVAIELQTEAGLVAIVHADCPFPTWQEFTAALEDPATPKNRLQSIIDSAQWARERVTAGDDCGVQGVRAVVVGHTPMERMTSLGNVLFIDTGAWLGQPALRPFCIIDAKTLRPAQPRSALQW